MRDYDREEHTNWVHAMAVKRTWMIVLSQSNFGHGDMWYVGVVCQDDNGEWTGHFGCEKLRYERWVVEIKGE
jgi:hypothetical protein